VHVSQRHQSPSSVRGPLSEAKGGGGGNEDFPSSVTILPTKRTSQQSQNPKHLSPEGTIEKDRPSIVTHLPPPTNRAIDLDESEVEELLQKLPPELQSPRQLAKILCGLSSPSFTKLKLTREKLYGVLEHHRFAEVVAWCEALHLESTQNGNGVT